MIVRSIQFVGKSTLIALKSPGGGNGNPLQYSCLENPHGQRSLAGSSLQGLTGSGTTECEREQTYIVRKRKVGGI